MYRKAALWHLLEGWRGQDLRRTSAPSEGSWHQSRGGRNRESKKPGFQLTLLSAGRSHSPRSETSNLKSVFTRVEELVLETAEFWVPVRHEVETSSWQLGVLVCREELEL